jgi:outer membrane protein assembly factor BamB
VGAGNTLSAFARDGSQLWSTRTEGGDISKAGAVMIDQTDAIVAVPAGNTLYALDAATGQIIWVVTPGRAALGAAVGNPNIIGDPTILVGDLDGDLYSIDRRTGDTLATFTAAAPVSGPAAIGAPDQTAPSVFVGDAGGDVYAFDSAEKLLPAWHIALGQPIGGSLVLAGDVVYVTTTPLLVGDPHIYALDAATGRVLFDTPLPGRGHASSPAAVDGVVVIGIATGDVVAYEGPDT